MRQHCELEGHCSYYFVIMVEFILTKVNGNLLLTINNILLILRGETDDKWAEKNESDEHGT